MSTFLILRQWHIHYTYIIHALGTHYIHTADAKGITGQERGCCIFQTNPGTLPLHFLPLSSVLMEISFTGITYVSVPYSCVCPVEGTLWKHRLSANCSWSLVYPDPILWPMTYDLPTSYQTMRIHSDTLRASRKQMWWSQTLIPSIRGDLLCSPRRTLVASGRNDPCSLRVPQQADAWTFLLLKSSLASTGTLPICQLPKCGVNCGVPHDKVAPLLDTLLKSGPRSVLSGFLDVVEIFPVVLHVPWFVRNAQTERGRRVWWWRT